MNVRVREEIKTKSVVRSQSNKMNKTLKKRRSFSEKLNTGNVMLMMNQDSSTASISSNLGTNKMMSPDQETNSNTNLNDSVEKTEQILPRGLYPVMAKYKMDRVLTVLRRKQKVSDYEKKLSQCVARLHTSAKPPWNSPSVILKAVKDCVIRRKWKNLTQLLLMLIHLPSIKYRPIIRHMCQILDKHHPAIQQKGLHNQFNIITLAYNSTKTGTTTLLK